MKLANRPLIINKIKKFEIGLQKIINQLLVVSLGFIFFSVVMIITTRVFNVFTYQVTGWYSLCTYVFIYASVLGTTNLLIRGEHVSILVLYEQFNETVKFVVSIINYILLALIHFYMLLYSLHWIGQTGKYIIVSLNMPRYPFQFALVLMSALVFILSILKITCLILGDERALHLGFDEEGR